MFNRLFGRKKGVNKKKGKNENKPSESKNTSEARISIENANNDCSFSMQSRFSYVLDSVSVSGSLHVHYNPDPDSVSTQSRFSYVLDPVSVSGSSHVHYNPDPDSMSSSPLHFEYDTDSDSVSRLLHFKYDLDSDSVRRNSYSDQDANGNMVRFVYHDEREDKFEPLFPDSDIQVYVGTPYASDEEGEDEGDRVKQAQEEKTSSRRKNKRSL